MIAHEAAIKISKLEDRLREVCREDNDEENPPIMILMPAASSSFGRRETFRERLVGNIVKFLQAPYDVEDTQEFHNALLEQLRELNEIEAKLNPLTNVKSVGATERRAVYLEAE